MPAVLHSEEPNLRDVVDRAIASEAVRSYFTRLPDVPGWFAPIDYLMFVALDEFHRRAGIGGDLLEIGAYAGKSAILLGLLRRRGEALTVCDVFDHGIVPPQDRAENAKWYGEGVKRAMFEANYLTFHSTLPTVIEGPSAGLTRASLDQACRIVHIDGSHVYETVMADLALARNVTARGGVVALDDYGRPHAPGVAAAAWESTFRHGLRPIFLTDSKLYATWDGDTELSVREHISQWARAVGLEAESYSVPTGELLFIHCRDAPRAHVARLVALTTPPILGAITRRVRASAARRRYGRHGRPRPALRGRGQGASG